MLTVRGLNIPISLMKAKAWVIFIVGGSTPTQTLAEHCVRKSWGLCLAVDSTFRSGAGSKPLYNVQRKWNMVLPCWRFYKAKRAQAVQGKCGFMSMCPSVCAREVQLHCFHQVHMHKISILPGESYYFKLRVKDQVTLRSCIISYWCLQNQPEI